MHTDEGAAPSSDHHIVEWRVHLYGALEALLPVLASSSNSSSQAEDGDSRDAPSSVAGAHNDGDDDDNEDGAAGPTIRTGIGGSPLVHLVHAILLQELSPLTGTTDDRVPHAVIQVCECVCVCFMVCLARQGPNTCVCVVRILQILRAWQRTTPAVGYVFAEAVHHTLVATREDAVQV